MGALDPVRSWGPLLSKITPVPYFYDSWRLTSSPRPGPVLPLAGELDFSFSREAFRAERDLPIPYISRTRPRAVCVEKKRGIRPAGRPEDISDAVFSLPFPRRFYTPSRDHVFQYADLDGEKSTQPTNFPAGHRRRLVFPREMRHPRHAPLRPLATDFGCSFFF